MSAAQMEAYRTAEATTVKGPYLFIAAIFIVVAVFIQLAHLPELQETPAKAGVASVNGISQSILSHAHLVKGVIAQFFYVGAQVGVASFVIRYAQFSVPGTPAKTAALYLLLHQIDLWLAAHRFGDNEEDCGRRDCCRSSPRHR